MLSLAANDEAGLAIALEALTICLAQLALAGSLAPWRKGKPLPHVHGLEVRGATAPVLAGDHTLGCHVLVHYTPVRVQ